MLRRPLTTLGLLACLALVMAGCGSSSSSTASTATTSSPARESTTSTSPSIEGYGAAAQGAEKAEVAKAAFSFFAAMAASEYPDLCAGLAASNREQLQAFTKAKRQKGGCPAVLKTLISNRGAPEARKAAAGTLTAVRVKGSTAFVLFRPQGGVPSYFVLKREGGAWRAIGLAPGTPLSPTATP
jgi:hypothetical protein